MRMVRNKILLKQAESADESKGGIALPETHKVRLPYGRIMDMGPDVLATLMGQVVLFNPLTLVELGEIKPGHILIEPDDIIAILEEGDY